ncbi:MAG TPA: 16S rRNA processing protein RimM [Acholeplasmataceae bacterium]|nr:16S rRNA processing protein RimM [Acholeplasmataceae bacterium]
MMYEIGIITTTHGIKGELKVKELSDFNRFVKGEKMFVVENNEQINLTVEAVRVHKNSLIVKFSEFNDINDVLRFKDLVIYSNTQGKLLEGEYYFQDLIDLEVYTDENKYVGIVTEVLEVPNGYILEIYDEDKKILVPFKEEFILEITNQKVIIKPIEGLI